MGFDKAKAVRAAEKQLAQGKISAAIQEYLRIVKNDPEDYTALNALGDLYVRVEQKQEAVGCFTRVAGHYREQGFTLKAIAVYKKVSRIQPGDIDVANTLATLYEKQGHLVEARTQYLTVADAYTRAGQTRDALNVLSRIANLDPNNIAIRLRLAESLQHEGASDKAADTFVEAGDMLSAREEGQKALDAYKRAHALDPSSHAVLQDLVAASLMVGDVEAAAAVLERASETARPISNCARCGPTYIDAEGDGGRARDRVAVICRASRSSSRWRDLTSSAVT